MPYTKNPRVIEVKALLSDGEFSELKRACAAADVKVSPLLRGLANAWIAEQKHSRQQANQELPACGHKAAMSYSGRSHGQINYGAANHMRRRL